MASEIEDLIAAGEQLKAQREADIAFHLAGQHDQASHGSWSDGSADLEAKASINVGDRIHFVPKGGQRAVTIEVTAKDRGRGGGISGKRVVNGVAKESVLHYETPSIGEIKKVGKPSAELTERLGTMKERIAAKTAAEVERLRGVNEKTIEAIKAEARAIGAERAAEKNAGNSSPAEQAAELGRGRTEVDKLRAVAENKAKRAREIAEGAPNSEAHMAAMKEAVAAEKAVRDAEIRAASGSPSEVKIHETGMAMQSGIRNGIQAGREAMKGAGLVGDFGTVEVAADVRGKSRYGAYAPWLNKIVMNDSRGGLPDQRGDGAFTFTHEYGHHIDHFEGRRTGEGGDQSSRADFKKAVRATQAYKNLKAAYDNAPARSYYRKRNKYLLTPTELFARAFAQWVTSKAGSSSAKAVLDRRRGDHWSDEDFAPMAEYFETHFGERKVRTQAGARRYGQSIDNCCRFGGVRNDSAT